MTEEKKLPTIEEWFEANKSEEGYAGMTVGFKKLVLCTSDQAVNEAFGDSLSGKIFCKNGKGGRIMEVNVTLNLVLSKDENGKIVYFIDESKVELV
jgi:hypothetical protein